MSGSSAGRDGRADKGASCWWSEPAMEETRLVARGGGPGDRPQCMPGTSPRRAPGAGVWTAPAR